MENSVKICLKFISAAGWRSCYHASFLHKAYDSTVTSCSLRHFSPGGSVPGCVLGSRVPGMKGTQPSPCRARGLVGVTDVGADEHNSEGFGLILTVASDLGSDNALSCTRVRHFSVYVLYTSTKVWTRDLFVITESQPVRRRL